MKNRLKPIVVPVGDLGDLTLHCRLEDIWPPVRGLLPDDTIEAQRARGEINDAEYERLKVWQKRCGLRQMDPEKCVKCPEVMVEVPKKKRGLVPLQDMLIKANLPPFATAKQGKK